MAALPSLISCLSENPSVELCLNRQCTSTIAISLSINQYFLQHHISKGFCHISTLQDNCIGSDFSVTWTGALINRSFKASQNHFSWKGRLKAFWPNQPPAMSRDAHSSIRCSEPHPLTSGICREGAATAFLGSLCDCLTALIIKDFFLISSLNVPRSGSKPFPLVLSRGAFNSTGIKWRATWNTQPNAEQVLPPVLIFPWQHMHHCSARSTAPTIGQGTPAVKYGLTKGLFLQADIFENH